MLWKEYVILDSFGLMGLDRINDKRGNFSDGLENRFKKHFISIY